VLQHAHCPVAVVRRVDVLKETGQRTDERTLTSVLGIVSPFAAWSVGSVNTASTGRAIGVAVMQGWEGSGAGPRSGVRSWS